MADEHAGRAESLTVFKGQVFLIRDRPRPWVDDLHCEYATMSRDAYGFNSFVWHPCEEGVMFDDIQPVASLAALAAMNYEPADG